MNTDGWKPEPAPEDEPLADFEQDRNRNLPPFRAGRCAEYPMYLGCIGLDRSTRRFRCRSRSRSAGPQSCGSHSAVLRHVTSQTQGSGPGLPGTPTTSFLLGRCQYEVASELRTGSLSSPVRGLAESSIFFSYRHSSPCSGETPPGRLETSASSFWCVVEGAYSLFCFGLVLFIFVVGQLTLLLVLLSLACQFVVFLFLVLFSHHAFAFQALSSSCLHVFLFCPFCWVSFFLFYTPFFLRCLYMSFPMPVFWGSHMMKMAALGMLVSDDFQMLGVIVRSYQHNPYRLAEDTHESCSFSRQCLNGFNEGRDGRTLRNCFVG